MDEMMVRIRAVNLINARWKIYKERRDKGLLTDTGRQDSNPFISSLRQRQMMFRDSSIDKLEFSLFDQDKFCEICSTESSQKLATRVCKGCQDMLYCEDCFKDMHERGHRKRHPYNFIEYE